MNEAMRKVYRVSDDKMFRAMRIREEAETIERAREKLCKLQAEQLHKQTIRTMLEAEPSEYFKETQETKAKEEFEKTIASATVSKAMAIAQAYTTYAEAIVSIRNESEEEMLIVAQENYDANQKKVE